MSNNNSQNTVVAAANNIRIAASVIADSRSTVRELSDARATLAFWTTELNKLGAANDMNNQTTTRTAPASVRYENEMPRQNAQPKVDNSKKGYVANGSGNWYSQFTWDTSDTKATWEQNKRDTEARIERKRNEAAERRAAHIFGMDKDGVIHAPGSVAIYMINVAITTKPSLEKRAWLLECAQKGIDIVDAELFENSTDGNYASLRELLDAMLNQFLYENPRSIIPTYVNEMKDVQIINIQTQLDAAMGRKATFAELFYTIIRKGAELEEMKEKTQAQVSRRRS